MLICSLKDGRREVSGIVELRDGVAAPDERARRFLDDHVVVEPGNPSCRLRFEDGLDYLLALPYNLAGTYCWAELEGRNVCGVPHTKLVADFKGSIE